MKNKLSSIELIRLNLEIILEQRNLSYKKFSDMVGMESSNIYKAIKGKRTISLALLDKFAKALSIEPEELIK